MFSEDILGKTQEKKNGCDAFVSGNINEETYNWRFRETREKTSRRYFSKSSESAVQHGTLVACSFLILNIFSYLGYHITLTGIGCSYLWGIYYTPNTVSHISTDTSYTHEENTSTYDMGHIASLGATVKRFRVPGLSTD